MDTSAIPKIFWYSLSVCMLVATIGFVLIAFRASSVSIETANAKISLTSALQSAKEIKHEIEKENRRLVNVNQELEKRLMSAAKKITPEVLSNSDNKINLSDLLKDDAGSGSDFIIKPVDPKVLEALQSNIDRAESAIHTDSALQFLESG